MSNKLWIFGHSLCLPFNLEDTQIGWANQLAEMLKLDLVNLSEPAVDNFFLYYKFLEYKSQINKDDIVVFGWSHYSRKLFMIDEKNPKHTQVIGTSLTYHTPKVNFMRNHNAVQGDPKKWLSMKPASRGVEFYDTWYNDYYNELEQKTHLQSYLDAVKYTCPGMYIPFYFSKESVEGVDIGEFHAGYATEFIIENQVSISNSDFHFNKVGHTMWADHIKNAIHGKNSENK